MSSLETICIVSLLVLSFTLFKVVEILRPLYNRGSMVKPLPELNNFNRVQVNCNEQSFYCDNDSDCSDICSSDSVLFSCDQKLKICSPMIEAATTNVNKREHVCNDQHGFFNVLSYNELNGFNWSCINTMPDFFNNEDDMHNFICNGGKFSIDVTHHYPRISDCKCSGETVTVVRKTNSKSPRCIDRRLLRFLPSFVMVN